MTAIRELARPRARSAAKAAATRPKPRPKPAERNDNKAAAMHVKTRRCG